MPETSSGPIEKHADRGFDEDWGNEGCLPPDEPLTPDEAKALADEAQVRIGQLKSDVEAGEVTESDRQRIAADAAYSLATRMISAKTYIQILDAVKVDDNGDLIEEMDPDSERVDSNGNVVLPHNQRPD